MTINPAELRKDKNFAKGEQEIHEKASFYINKMKSLKPFDAVHKLQPQTYDLKMLGDPAAGRAKKKSSKEIDKKKSDAVKKQKKKAAAKLGGDGFLDEIEEDEKDNKPSDDDTDDDNPDDKYDPLARQKEGGPKLKKQSML